ncbi:PREDICTED: WD repeat-containing protein 61-like, partial [Acropora digitifera]|uniref:WD repeat-containing protein 61-like n=1 Tax=Acropora digitifera TaxID=70779 RepID=UPI00077AEAE0
MSQYSVCFKQDQAHEDSIWTVAWGTSDKDGTENIVTGAVDDMVKCWRWTEDKLHLRFNFEGHQLGVVSVDVNLTGTRIISQILIIQSPDGHYIACGAIDGIINIFDLTTGKLLHTLEGHAMPIRSLTFSPDSQLLITASDDNHIKIYDVQHANLAGTLSGHGSWVLGVSFCPDNTHFVSRYSDKNGDEALNPLDAHDKRCGK